MRYGVGAFDLTGTPLRHGGAMQMVADRTGHGIILRAVGAHCTRLLEEGYAGKGFRIDTKSCDWGPMRGFVCIDPRLSKAGRSKEVANRKFTEEALLGNIRHDAIGGLDLNSPDLDDIKAGWTAGCKPIVISAGRLQELREGGHLSIKGSWAGILHGVSSDAKGEIQLPWRLLPVNMCLRSAGFRAACPDAPSSGFGLFIDNSADIAFRQEYPAAVEPINVMGFEAILGLINPGTEGYGYRACVTGDYDLFGVWPPAEQAKHQTHNRPSSADLRRAIGAIRPGGRNIIPSVPDTTWDKRFVAQFKGQVNAHYHQHFQLGNITRRINLIKVQLNTTLQSAGGFAGGALVHHSDEVGNPSPGLKKTLVESMPLIAFLPQKIQAFGVENTMDFQTLVQVGVGSGIVPDLRPEWNNFL